MNSMKPLNSLDIPKVGEQKVLSLWETVKRKHF
jgi:hypothetical protein